jgi:protein-L-isoaspartate(D-aspartate) O-methyltransferase
MPFFLNKEAIIMSPVSHVFLEPLREMLQKIQEQARDAAPITGIQKISNKVIHAMKQVPRHLFVRAEEEACAYLNCALPIDEKQTISQPFIVALMTELLDLKLTDKILEIGTGSGYQAAILSKLAAEVHTVEIFSTLAKSTHLRLRKLDCLNVHVHEENGYHGWQRNAPYDKIIVTASAEQIPQPLVD